MTIAMASSLGQVAFHARRPYAAPRFAVGIASVWARSRSVATATAHLLAELVGDGRGQGRYLGRVDAPGPGDRDVVDGGHSTGPARKQHHAVTETHGLAHIVSHEEDRLARGGPQGLELVVQEVAGH